MKTMSKPEIIIENTDITLRPSSVDGSTQCGFQWAKVFLEGVMTIPGARAAIGTGIHAGAEIMWRESMASGVKDPNLDMMNDAGIEAFQEENKKGIKFDDGEDQNTAEAEIIRGNAAWVEDLVPFLDIPTGVEERFTMAISGHPIVKCISGTVDYIAPGIIDDVKTSKRKPSVGNHVTQQTIYKLLAEHNGHDIHTQRIQGVALLKSGANGHLLEIQPNVERTKYIVNGLLDKIRYAVKDVVPIDVLFSCNTKYYLCSDKYCSLHGSCPATRRMANNDAKPIM